MDTMYMLGYIYRSILYTSSISMMIYTSRGGCIFSCYICFSVLENYESR
jgi:hypothetical protein